MTTYEITGADYCWLIGLADLFHGHTFAAWYEDEMTPYGYFTDQDGYDRLHACTR